MVEYSASVIGLHITEEWEVKYLEAYGDSKLIVSQVKGEYDVRNKNLVPYHQATINWAEKFREFYINHITQNDNMHADVFGGKGIFFHGY